MVAMKAVSPFTSSLRSQRQRLSRLNYRQLFTLALLAIFACLSRTMWNRKNKNETMQQQQQQQPKQPPTPSNDTPTKLQVNYIEVASGRSDAKRYHATLNSNTTSISDQPISIRTWMSLVSSNSTEGIQAASDLSNIIASSSYKSLLFETPGTSWGSSDRDQFEFAIVNKPSLARAETYPDRDAFAEHFERCRDHDGNGSTEANSMVCSFANLGGDAQLVAPLPLPQPSVNCCASVLGCPDTNDGTYSHLAAFVRNAPKCQVAEFWRVGAHRMLETLERKHKHDTQQRNNVEDNDKTWFSTNGMGVSWLHLRLDGRPKYYDYEPFAYSNANLPR